MSYGPGGQRRSWTFAEYCALPEDGQRYEVLDGELVVVPSPNRRHQSIIVDLVLLLRPRLDAHVTVRRAAAPERFEQALLPGLAIALEGLLPG